MIWNQRKNIISIEAVFKSTQVDEKLTLSSHQIEMLKMSEMNIEQGNLISETDLEKLDSE